MRLPKQVAAFCALAFIGTAAYADTLTVTTTELYGPGSLPAVIEEANNNGVASHIVFDIPGGGTILTNVDFPAINSPVFIDGSNATGDVILEGASPNGPGAPASGLIFEELAMHSTVKNLSTKGFLNAIWIKTAKISVNGCSFDNTFARGVRIEPTEISSNPMSNLASSVSNCTFTNMGGLSIQVIKEGGTSITDNTFYSGSIVIDSSENVTVRGNTFDNNGASAGAALLLRNSRTSYVSNNLFKNQPEDALLMNDNDDQDLWNRIDFNTFENNRGYDIALYGTKNTSILNNQITGDALAIEAGIYLENVTGTMIQRNTLTNSRITAENSVEFQIGGMGEDKNSITGDSQGVSAYGAIILTNTDKVDIIGNEIANNNSNGIRIYNGNGHEIFYNTIHDNGRTGVKVELGNQNAIRYNTIYNHHSDAMGGVNSISLLGAANNSKEAPVITSVVSDGASEVVVTGKGNPGDIINVFQSTKPASILSVDAIADLGVTGVMSDSTWTLTIPASKVSLAELYITANATDTDGNSSELSWVESVIVTDGIAGASEVTRGLTFNYSVPNIDNTEFQWWVNGDVTITGNGTNAIEAIFHNAPGTVLTLCVGYSDPEKGWTVEELEITVK